MDRYEQHILRTFAKNAIDGERNVRQRLPKGELASWLYHHCDLLGAPAPDIAESEIDTNANAVSPQVWAAFKPLVANLRQTRKAPRASGLERRLDWICHTLGLRAVETDVLKTTVRIALHVPFQRLASSLSGSHTLGEISAVVLSVLTGHGRGRLFRELTGRPTLTVLGLLEDRFNGDFAPSETVLRIARQSTTDPHRLRALLSGKPKKASLRWDEFSYLGEDVETVSRILTGALASQSEGINILLSGPPGTGKTEFVRTLADRLGVYAAFVGETDDSNREPNRSERVAALALARAVATRAGNTLLIVDEADDIFVGMDGDDGKAKVGSKVFMHRMVESGSSPTIWITNHPDRLGSAILRRMTFALHFPTPSRAVRRRTIDRIVRRHRIRLTAEGLERLSVLEAPPAIYDNAIRAAKLAGGDADTAHAAARSLLAALNGPSPPAALPSPLAFDPELSSADRDLAALAERLAATGDLAYSMCLHGLPGTGKSAYARYVALKTGLDVVEKRASDLLSMWVGETEKKIAKAFQEAADRKAMLIIDEADTMLRDRAGARASWEVSRVNEMLTWMERHPYPVVCTTNLMDSLDPATLRRFLFKVRFMPMTSGQIDVAFRRAFNAAPPAKVLALDLLAPGDFALVGRQAKLMGVSDLDAIGGMLAAEVTAKPGASQGRMGF